MRKFGLLLLLSIAVLAPATLRAQSCALCYTQAAGAGGKMIAALKSGILVLVFPPMGICVFLTVLGYRKRNRYYLLNSSGSNDEPASPNADLGW